MNVTENKPPIQVTTPSASEEKKPKSADDLIDSFEEGKPDPLAEKAERELLEGLESDKPIEGLHRQILDSGMIEKWLLKVLTWGFVGLNVWVYNMIMRRGKRQLD